MLTIRLLKAVFPLSLLLSAGLALTACGNGVGVSPADTAAVAGIPPVTNPTTPSQPPASPTTGSATLSWTIPTENMDGSPLTDLAGYHIYYGNSEGAWTSTITVLDATETSYVLNGLSAGTYYFTVVAFNSAGIDSPESNIGSKTI